MDMFVAEMFEMGEMFSRMSPQELRASDPQTPEQMASPTALLQYFAIAWYRAGCPRFTLESLHAAAVMCTDPSACVLGDIRPPFGTFMVSIPDGVLPMPTPAGQQERYATNFFCQVNSDGAFIYMADHSAVLDDAVVTSLTNCGEFRHKGAEKELASRLVAGTCIEATALRVSWTDSTRGNKRRERDGTPIVPTFALARPVTIDCRATVRSYVRGDGSSLEMRSFVRGHWKRQVFGERRAQRRIQFIEPYWRGDEALPIAFRPHTFATP